jgi:hypothetical protein
MTYTMQDFNHQFTKEHFAQLTPQEQREALARLSPEQQQQIREYLDQLTAARPEQPRKSRRKK